MHDSLYSHSPDLDGPKLIAYADQLGMSLDIFTREMLEHTHAEKVNDDCAAAVEDGVDETPEREYCVSEIHPTLPRYGTDIIQAQIVTLKGKAAVIAKGLSTISGGSCGRWSPSGPPNPTTFLANR